MYLDVKTNRAYKTLVAGEISFRYCKLRVKKMCL